MTQRREHERFEIDLPVVMVVDEDHIAARTRNVAQGGAYVLTEQSIPYGTKLKIRLKFPALKEESEIEATVRWVRDDGIGLQFGSLRAVEVWAVNQLFRKPTPEARPVEPQPEPEGIEAAAEGGEMPAVDVDASPI